MNCPLSKARKARGRILVRRNALLAFFFSLLTGATLLINGCASKPVETSEGPDGVQVVKVVVQHGYRPSHIQAKAGQPLRIEFYRDEEPDTESCGQELEIPAEGVRIPLPARQSQIVEIKPQAPGEIAFQCGMNMMKGKITFQ